MKLKLPNGTTGFYNEHNERIVTGSQMGRRNTLPNDLPDSDRQDTYKLHLVRVPFVDGDYDQGGAYWGSPANLYLASESLPSPSGITVYVRASSRHEAKQKVLSLVPTAKFYR